jgi:anti-anti-sigma factor
MEIVFENTGNVLILALKGRLDTTNHMEFEKRLLDAFLDNKIILLDCAGLDYISSSGLRALLMGLKKADREGRQLALCSLQPTITEIFRISAFINLFKVFPSQQQALAELS